MQNLKKRSKTARVKALAMFMSIFIFLLFSAVFCNYTTLNINENCNTLHQNCENIIKKYDFENVVLAAQNDYVHIGGNPLGISISAGGLIVVGQNAVPTTFGEVYPTKEFDIRSGDVLIEANDEKVNSIYRLKTITQDKKEVKLKFVRGEQTFDVNVKTALDKISGEYKLGLMLKEDIGGIGTLTFVTQDGRFGALGHYIVDNDTGLKEELDEGFIYKSSVEDVVKGERGKAGGLVADVNRLSTPVGEIEYNTNIGLYGKYDDDFDGDLYRIALKGEAKIGHAQILTTIEGDTPKFYDIDIVKVVSQEQSAEKGMVICVRDSELLSKTGGIVQGMSGSPIVQNGILIGAVTHVFVQDPTRGYAVHSRFMYEQAKDAKNGNLNEYNSFAA